MQSEKRWLTAVVTCGVPQSKRPATPPAPLRAAACPANSRADSEAWSVFGAFFLPLNGC